MVSGAPVWQAGSPRRVRTELGPRGQVDGPPGPVELAGRSRRERNEAPPGIRHGSVKAVGSDYVADLDPDQLVDGVYSALGVNRLPAPDQRPVFAAQVRAALAPHDHFSEHVRITILAGRSG
jgi:hypothetical protein